MQPGLSIPREFIFDPKTSPTVPTESFVAAMQMLTTKITGTYFPQEIVDKIVNFLIDFHPRPDQKAIHCSILRSIGTEAWPTDDRIRGMGPHLLDFASITILCYNVHDFQSFKQLRDFWEQSPNGYSYPAYLRKWVVVIGTIRADELLPGGVLTRAIGHHEGPRFASQAGRDTSFASALSGGIESNHFECNIDSLSEVEDVFQKIVDVVGWSQLEDAMLEREEEERERGLREAAQRQRREGRRRTREDKRPGGWMSKLAKLISR